jgi:predicted transcriptional regulator
MQAKDRVVKSELKAILAKKGIKIKDLSEQTGILYDTLLKKIHGYIPFKQDEIEKIKLILGIAAKDVYKYFF